MSSQSKTELYVIKYSDLAIREMKQYKIPASITLSQGILESGNGESRLHPKEITILELNVMDGKDKKFMQTMMRKTNALESIEK